MIAAAVIIAVFVFPSLCAVAYRFGWKMAKRRARASVPKALEKPLRCECRRYAFPSPLCPLHGGLA